MRHYIDFVATILGVPVPGATVDVRVANAVPGTGALATIYSDDGITVTANPVTCDSTGTFNFYVADGRYDLVVKILNVIQRTQADVEIADVTQTNLGDATFNIAAANIGTLAVSANETIGGTLVVTGGTTLNSGALNGTFSGNPTLSGNVSVGGTLGVTGSTTLNSGTFNGTFAGNPTLSGNVSVGGTFGVTGTTTLNSGTLNGTFGGNPTLSGNLLIGGTLGVTGLTSLKNLENTRYAADFAGADMAAKIVAAYNDGPATGVCVDATSFEGTQTWGSDPFAGIAFGSTKSLYLKLGNVAVSSSVALNIKCSNIAIEGRGWNQTSISYTGGAITNFFTAGTASPTVNQLFGVRLIDFQISGNANVVNALFFTGCHHWRMDNIDTRNCTGAGFATSFAVGGVAINYSCSLNHGAFSTQPVNGVLLGQIDASHQTTGTTFITPISEGLSGTAIKLNGAEGCVFISGTGEQSNRGLEVTSVAGSNRQNTFISMDLESNTVEDILDNGLDSVYKNCFAFKQVHFGASSISPQVEGGHTNNVLIDAGCSNAKVDSVSYNNSGTGTFTDNGSNTNVTRLINAATATIVGAPYTFREIIPSFTVAAFAQIDPQDTFFGSYIFTNVATLLSNVAYTATVWRVIFVGQWESNFEGGGLTQQAPYIEATNVAPTIAIGATTLTVALNGSSQFIVTASANKIPFSGRIYITAHNVGVAGTESMRLKGSVSTNLGTLGAVIASGTSTLTANAALAAATGQAAITTAASGAATTDAIEWSYASAPTAGDTFCILSAYPTANNVNFVRTNPTAAAQNVSALVVNWRVIR